MTRLSSFDLIRYAVVAMVRNFATLVGLCAPALLILVAAAVIARLQAPAAVDADAPELGLPPVLGVAMLFAQVALIPAFTGWHRLLVLGDARRENGRAYGWDGREWRYLRYLLVIWALIILVNIVANLVAGAGGPAALVAGLGALVAYLAIWATLGPALPAAALGDARTLDEIRRMVAGNTGRIAMGLAGIWLLIAAVGLVLTLALIALGPAIGSVVLTFVLVMLFCYLGLVAAVGVLSRAYALLSASAPPPAAAGAD